MAVTLTRGENVSLSREDPTLTHLLVGLGWGTRETDGEAFDLDASAFLLDADNRVLSDSDFIFYNNLVSTCGSVTHAGDNLTGASKEAGDSEVLRVDLTLVPAVVEKISFAVSIHQAELRQQNFGMVRNAYIRLVNDKSEEVLARFDLSEDASIETAVVFGEIYRFGSEWKFRAVAQGLPGGLAELARQYGVNVE